MTEWKLFAKSSLRHKILLQNTRQRKQRRYLRACFVRFITHAQEYGFTGIGVNQKGNSRFIHLDIADHSEERPRPTVWSY